ncbi:zinc finger, CCHC-type containing protein [Tanacetum coccineum]
MTTTVVNNSVFRGFFEKQKLTGPNLIDWYRQLCIILSAEDKLNYLEHPIHAAPVPAFAGQQVPSEALAAHAAWVKGQKEIVVEQELLQTVREFHVCKQEERQSVSSYVLKMTIYIDNLEHLVSLSLAVSLILVSLQKEYDSFVQNYDMHGMGKTVNELHVMLKVHEQTLLRKDTAPALHKGKSKIAYAPKPKIFPPPKKDNPVKDAICHQCGDVGHWKRNCPQYIAELLKNKKLKELALQGLRGSRKLKPGALSLYVGDGHRAVIEAIGSYHLCLPSGLVLVLHNCHYSPSITRGIISVSRLYDDGFVNRFDGNTISVSRSNVVYFSVIPRNGIFEIDLSNSNKNDCSMYVVSNKRAKTNLDSTLLWHCHLGHISKKRIEKLQHDGLLNSIGNQSLWKTIKSLRSNRGGEYMIQEFLDHLKEHGIIVYRTPSYTPQHNGVSERRNRTLLDMVRSMMSQTTLSKSFWDYSLESSACILNMVPTKKVEKTPYEIWHGQAPKLCYLQVRGYPKKTIGYSFYHLPKNKIFVAQNAEFLKNSLMTQEASRSLEDLEIIQEEDTHPSENTSSHHDEDDQEINEPQSDINPIRRSTRTRRAPDRMCLYIDAEEHELEDLNEPIKYKAALLYPESEKWLNAMNVKIQSMKDSELWDLVDLPLDGKTVGSKWLFKKKTNIDGVVHTYRARLVAKGLTQTYAVDYEETFSPVVDIRAIRIPVAIDAFYDYEIWQVDVKTAFLNEHLSEEVYMMQPEGFVNSKYPNQVCKLKHSIYELKQASRQWNKRFDDEINKFGFTQNHDEPCVYKKASGSNVNFLILYVNDVLIMGNHILILQDVKSYLGRCFAMKDLGEAVYILGIKIYRDRSKRLIEAEYIAAYDALKEAVWIMRFIFGLSIVPTIEEPITMYCDNTGAITIANESAITKGARHYRAKVHYLREVIELGDIKLEKVHTYNNLVDPFTKPLPLAKHSEHTQNIGMLPASSLM